MIGFDEIGKWIIIGGLILMVIGGIVWLIGRGSFLANFPGTIQIAQGNFGCVIPVGLMIVISVVGTVVLNILIRLLNK